VAAAGELTVDNSVRIGPADPTEPQPSGEARVVHRINDRLFVGGATALGEGFDFGRTGPTSPAYVGPNGEEWFTGRYEQMATLAVSPYTGGVALAGSGVASQRYTMRDYNAGWPGPSASVSVDERWGWGKKIAVCEVSGVTGSTRPNITAIPNGTSFMDGTVQWRVTGNTGLQGALALVGLADINDGVGFWVEYKELVVAPDGGGGYLNESVVRNFDKDDPPDITKPFQGQVLNWYACNNGLTPSGMSMKPATAAIAVGANPDTDPELGFHAALVCQANAFTTDFNGISNVIRLYSGNHSITWYDDDNNPNRGYIRSIITTSGSARGIEFNDEALNLRTGVARISSGNDAILQIDRISGDAKIEFRQSDGTVSQEMQMAGGGNLNFRSDGTRLLTLDANVPEVQLPEGATVGQGTGSTVFYFQRGNGAGQDTILRFLSGNDKANDRTWEIAQPFDDGNDLVFRRYSGGSDEEVVRFYRGSGRARFQGLVEAFGGFIEEPVTDAPTALTAGLMQHRLNPDGKLEIYWRAPSGGPVGQRVATFTPGDYGQLPTYTQAEIEDATTEINTDPTAKLRSLIIDTTNNRICFAIGSNATSPWYYINTDGTYTPS